MDRSLPTAVDVAAARRRVRGIAEVTPVIPSVSLAAAAGVPIWLKAECLQVTGSFKVRGAANALTLLSERGAVPGVVAVSSGNHGRAVAHVARSLGIPAVICLSERVPAHKRDAIADLGARVVVAGPTQESAEAEARRLVEAEGLVFVHPFDDPSVIAGQGTVGLEILIQVPDARCVVVPLSGGGLIAGIGLAVEPEESGVRVFGASQDRGPAMHDSLRAGRLVDVVEEDTLADALAGGLGEENHYTFDLCRQLVEDVVLVSEDEMAEAIRLLHRDHDLKVEGGGAVGVAAVLTGRLPLDGPTVVVVSGGNIGEHAWKAIVEDRVAGSS
ncbi:MAG: pyridoxal-phosphate dependent enzyme [Acidimicrobiia bacterium]